MVCSLFLHLPQRKSTDGNPTRLELPANVTAWGQDLLVALAGAAGVTAATEVCTEEQLTGGKAACRTIANAEDGDVVLVADTLDLQQLRSAPAVKAADPHDQQRYVHILADDPCVLLFGLGVVL